MYHDWYKSVISTLPLFFLILTFLLACTFLGPSRKRGPPKGYIDAIEARLHQTEALLGIIIAAKDTRAQSLLHDISKVLTSQRYTSFLTSHSSFRTL